MDPNASTDPASTDPAPTFAGLHRPGDPFVLPNAWDLASARLLADQAFPAVGTTSLGVAATHGLVDASRVARDVTVGLAHDLVGLGLGCWLTIDVEDGFSDDPAEVADLVAGLGVDGVNIEDCSRGQLVDPRLAASKVAAVKAAAPHVFVNARTDVYWLGVDDVEDAVARLQAYADAGADGVFAPGTADPRVIETIAARVDAPLNVLASSDLPRTRMAELGIARISTGSLLHRTSLSAAVDTAVAVRDGGTFTSPISYDAVQDLARRTTQAG